MKKILSIMLALLLVVGLASCRGAEAPAEPVAEEPAATETETTTDEPVEVEVDEDYKIGIITGTVSQGEEEYQAAQNMVKKYGDDKIITATYPDKFSDEIETTIAQVVNLASDPAVKAIIICQAVPGSTAAIEKVRETRPEMLFIAGVPQEAPRVVSEAADFIMQVDEISMGTKVVEQAQKMGATTFVHYSFPRHLGIETIAKRAALFKETAEKLGLEYVEATAPDPTGDAGVAGAQEFIREDVPRKIAEYGADTAFFSTNCAMQEPLIDEVMKAKAIYPQQCCPSPYHGYPAALNIETTGHEGDVQYILDQITEKIAEGGNSGRMSTWPLPINMLMVEAGVEYAIEYAEGRTEGNFDDAKAREAIAKVAKDYGASETLSYYSDDSGQLDNYFMILTDFYDF